MSDSLSVSPPSSHPLRLGVVRFLNAQPLISGLAEDPSVRLFFDVPSALLADLLADKVDVALLPVADLWHAPVRLRRLGDAIIGADEHSLTVKLFTRRPPGELTRIAADPDSHTSVKLLELLCRHVWHCRPQIVPLPPAPADWAGLESCLLIGDKVITEAERFRGLSAKPKTTNTAPHTFLEYDLAAEWRKWTGKPFVFAAWVGKKARRDLPWAGLAARLSAARDRGLCELPTIVNREAPRRGWPKPLALEYLSRNMSYRLTPAHREGLALFLRMLRNPQDWQPIPPSRTKGALYA